MKKLFESKTEKGMISLVILLSISFFSFSIYSPPVLRTSNFKLRTTNFELQTSPGGEDSTKGKYALNDPRNPDCPCHKYQKLAEDEYRKLTENPEEDIKTTTDNKKITTKEKTDINSKKKNVSEKSSREKFFKKFLRKHRISGGKHGRERKKKGLLDCFHWH